MKKVIKNPIFTFILGIAIALSIVGVYAISASEITYNDTTVDLVLDDLYEKASDPLNLLTILNSSNDFTIPEGINKIYVLFSHGTSADSLTTFTISGNTYISKSIIKTVSRVDTYDQALRSTLDIYEVNLTGEGGTLSFSASGGSGRRAWAAMVMY